MACHYTVMSVSCLSTCFQLFSLREVPACYTGTLRSSKSARATTQPTNLAPGERGHQSRLSGFNLLFQLASSARSISRCRPASTCAAPPTPPQKGTLSYLFLFFCILRHISTIIQTQYIPQCHWGIMVASQRHLLSHEDNHPPPPLPPPPPPPPPAPPPAPPPPPPTTPANFDNSQPPRQLYISL